MFDVGNTVICQHDRFFNAFGDHTEMLHKGQRLTIKQTKRIGGATFLEFDEAEKDNWFLQTGFKPMRALN